MTAPLDADLAALADVRAQGSARPPSVRRARRRRPGDRSTTYVRAMAHGRHEAAEELARLAVDETGYGVYEHKIYKNRYNTGFVARWMLERRAVGVLWVDEQARVTAVGSPMGVIAGDHPGHQPDVDRAVQEPGRGEVGQRDRARPAPAGGSVHAAGGGGHGRGGGGGRRPGRADLLPARPRPCTATEELMRRPEIALVLATGGPGMVRRPTRAASRRSRSARQRPGLRRSERADPAEAAEMIVTSKAFDNGTACVAEQSVVVGGRRWRRRSWRSSRPRGAHWLNAAQQAALVAGAVRRARCDCARTRSARPRSGWPSWPGSPCPTTTRVLAAELTRSVGRTPRSRARSSVRCCRSTASATPTAGWTGAAAEILALGGEGHTLCRARQPIRTRSPSSGTLPAGRIVVNTPALFGGMGVLDGRRSVLPARHRHLERLDLLGQRHAAAPDQHQADRARGAAVARPSTTRWSSRAWPPDPRDPAAPPRRCRVISAAAEPPSFSAAAQPRAGPAPGTATGPLRVGVDLGHGQLRPGRARRRRPPAVGGQRTRRTRWRDGVVVDFAAATATVRAAAGAGRARRSERPTGHRGDGLPARRRGRATRGHAPTCVRRPVSPTWCSSTRSAPRSARSTCDDGVIVDVGGGSTGIGVFRGGRLAALDDRAGGGSPPGSGAGRRAGPAASRTRRPHKRDHHGVALPILVPGLQRIAESVRAMTRGAEELPLHLAGGALMIAGADDVLAKLPGANRGDLPARPADHAHRDRAERGMSVTSPTLRTYAFIDRMQPQCAAHIAATSPGDVPLAGMAELYIEMAPGNEIFRAADIALKAAGVRPGAADHRARVRPAGDPLRAAGGGAGIGSGGARRAGR